MKWKTILILLIILAIIGILINTDLGQKVLNMFKSRFENVTSVLKEEEIRRIFPLTLTTQKESFFNKSFKISNSNFNAMGISQTINIGDILRRREGETVNLSIQIDEGMFNYTDIGNIRLIALSDNFRIDDYESVPGKKLNIEIEFVPFNFLLTNIVENELVFSSLSGESSIGGERGKLRLFSNDTLEIWGFKGYMQLYENGTISLSGIGEKVLINQENTII
jgi:hypothetical protein